jgi:hypothetical protein
MTQSEMAQCPLAHYDAAYVLGSLSPTDRLEFERHLPGCARCRRSVTELAGLPGLLGRVPREQIEAPLPFEPLPETVLPALVAAVRREQRRKAVLVTLAAAAAIAVIALGVGALQAARDNGRAPEAAPTSASAGVAPFLPMDVVVDWGMRAEVSLTPAPGGTNLLVNCTYAESEESGGHAYHYKLVVHTRGGGSFQAMDWTAGPGDVLKAMSATTATPLDDIRRVEVQNDHGDTVLKLKL